VGNNEKSDATSVDTCISIESINSKPEGIVLYVFPWVSQIIMEFLNYT
jgi:hypothetical protein